MNAVDIVVLIIAALCVLWGFYRGFVQTLLNLLGGIVSFVGSFLLYPAMSEALLRNQAISNLISSITDSNSLLGNLDLSSMSVSGLDAGTITSVVERANLPDPIGSLLKTNLANRVFSTVNQGISNVGDYVNQTILTVSMNVVCFIICFIVQLPILHILTSKYNICVHL